MEKSMQEIKAFIFDMDGVILDSETICDKAWLEVAKKQKKLSQDGISPDLLPPMLLKQREEAKGQRTFFFILFILILGLLWQSSG